jgi:hypothetical protein
MGTLRRFVRMNHASDKYLWYLYTFENRTSSCARTFLLITICARAVRFLSREGDAIINMFLMPSSSGKLALMQFFLPFVAITVRTYDQMDELRCELLLIKSSTRSHYCYQRATWLRRKGETLFLGVCVSDFPLSLAFSPFLCQSIYPLSLSYPPDKYPLSDK